MPAISSSLPELLPAAAAASAAQVLAATRLSFVSAMAWTVGPDWSMGGQPKPDCYLVTPSVGAIDFGWDHLRRLEPGQLALAPTGAPLHGCLATGQQRAELLVVHALLDTDWGPSLPALAADWVIRLPQAAAQRERLHQVVALCGREPAAGRRLGEHWLGALLGELLLAGALRIHDPGQAYDPRVAAALRAIRDEPGGEHDVDELAARCGLRPVRFRQLFKQALGVGPKRYQLDHRLDLAARRLRHGDERIGSIAVQLGFPNQPYFQNRFKQRFGCTPGDFRARAAGL
jgi:AraC-like DNA-binding protein